MLTQRHEGAPHRQAARWVGHDHRQLGDALPAPCEQPHHERPRERGCGSWSPPARWSTSLVVAKYSETSGLPVDFVEMIAIGNRGYTLHVVVANP